MGRRCNRDCPRKKTSKDSVVHLINTYIAGEKRSARKPFSHSRTYTPRKLHQYELNLERRGIDGDDVIAEENFYDVVTGTCYNYQPKLYCKNFKKPKIEGYYDTVDHGESSNSSKRAPKTIKPKVAPVVQSGFAVTSSRSVETYATLRSKDDDKDDEDERDGDEVDLIPDSLERAFDNSNRDAIGIGILSKIFGSGKATEAEGFQQDRDSRPFFTYWISIVQIIIFIVVVSTYGIAPYGFGHIRETGKILMTSQTIEQVEKDVLTNMWVGPRTEDLIHVGARYSMCMRNDTNLLEALKKDKKKLKNTACCVQNDGSGCLQTSRDACSTFVANWMKWSKDQPADRDIERTSGTVCGQDPVYCRRPSYIWPDDITEWPICEKEIDTQISADDHHMKCELLGRPCCVGIQGECMMATPEYCKFQRGYYHAEATLCSQVNCMEDVCGMIPFSDPNTPDQFYRLFSVMFLHAGILDLVITIAIQVIFMRDLEKLISCWRVVIIYIGSNISGSLASATFIPYYVENGPSGATYGIIAALYLEVLRFERRVKDAQIWKTLLKMGASLVLLFFVGLCLPQVDNFAHMFGFLFGLLIAYALRPYKRVCNYTLSTWVLVVIGISVGLTALGLFVMFILIFYLAPQRDCDSCLHLNCIPFTETYCEGMKVQIR